MLCLIFKGPSGNTFFVAVENNQHIPNPGSDSSNPNTQHNVNTGSEATTVNHVVHTPKQSVLLVYPGGDGHIGGTVGEVVTMGNTRVSPTEEAHVGIDQTGNACQPGD